MYHNNNKLQLTIAASDSYGIFMRGYKLSEKLVPCLDRRTDIFSRRRNRISALRKAGITILSFLLFLFPHPGRCAEPLSLEQLTARTQEIYEKTSDLKASFIQEVTIKSMKKTEREEGVVTFKNPRMMLWDYLKPKAKKLVINAQKAWLYVPEDRMVYVQNADDVYRSRMAVKFLSGIGKLSDDFQIRFTKDNPLDAEGNYNLALTAKEAGGGIEKLYLIVDGKTFQITQCRFNDAFGNTTRLRFSDIRLNTGVSDKFFTFTTPAGVEEVSMPQ
jgi:outer membrane lipoprotein carrier protein